MNLNDKILQAAKEIGLKVFTTKDVAKGSLKLEPGKVQILVIDDEKKPTFNGKEINHE